MSSSSSNSTTISSASPDPPPATSTSPITTQTLYQSPMTSNLAILIFLTSPIIALLPPRKLDIYTFCLGSAFVLSAGHIYGSESPTSSRLRRFINRQRHSSAHSNNLNNPYPYNNSTTVAAPVVEREVDERNQYQGRGGVKAMAKKLWMGDETVGWEERRVAREREVLDEGGGIGYGELIGESIMDVFGGKVEREEKGKGD